MGSKIRVEKVWLRYASKAKLSGSSKFGLVLINCLVGHTRAWLETCNWAIAYNVSLEFRGSAQQRLLIHPELKKTKKTSFKHKHKRTMGRNLKGGNSK